MNKCVCKVRHLYFVRVNRCWFECSRSFFRQLRDDIGLSCSEPYDYGFLRGIWFVPIDDFLFKKIICRTYYLDDISFGCAEPFLIDCECYVKENN